MPFYRLREELSCCQVDGHLVFLDTRHDRYFRLSIFMERAFTTYINGGIDPDTAVEVLIERGILAAKPSSEPTTLAPPVEYPTRSAMELLPTSRRVQMSILLDVFAIVCSTRLRLATGRLKSILDGLIAYRQRVVPNAPPSLENSEVMPYLEAACMYRRARCYVPIEPRCLLDSLAMTRFLAKRRLHASVVFGVTGEPFSAHAWVQVLDLVLSDTVGNASAHTPVRVV